MGKSVVMSSASPPEMQISRLGEGVPGGVSLPGSTAVCQTGMGRQSPGQEGFLVRLGANAGAGVFSF